MAKVIRCQCGFLGHGETVEEAATAIEAHMRSTIPSWSARSPGRT